MIKKTTKVKIKLEMYATGTCIEFALHPQHETSCDSEIQTREDFKNKFRKLY